MNKKRKVDWSNVDGALPKSKRLHLEKEEADSLYHCPIQVCDPKGFQSQRGCRKHVNNKHSWLFYFDEKPAMKAVTVSLEVAKGKQVTNSVDGASSLIRKPAKQTT